MNTLEIIAQIIGFLALAANISSFHFKKYNQIVIVQMLSSVLFTTHFALLYSSGQTDALTAGALNGLSLFRNALLLITAAPFAFTYDLLIGSIGGSINEAISFLSALAAYRRNRSAGSSKPVT